MSLANRTSRSFSAPVRSQGWRQFQRGFVDVTGGSETSLRASVYDGQACSVALDFEGQTLVVRCTCASFAAGRKCPHMWAAILAAARSPHMRAAGRGYTDLRVSTRGTSTTPPAEETPRWARLFAQAEGLTPPETTGTPDVEIAYIVDLQETVAARRLVVDVVQPGRRSKKGGDEPGWTPYPVTRDGVNRLARHEDRAILGALTGADPQFGYSTYPGPTSGPGASRFQLDRAARELLLPMMCKTGRCRVRRERGEAEPGLLRWDDGEPYRVLMRVREAPGAPSKRAVPDPDWEIEGVLVRGEESISLDRIALVLGDDMACVGDTVVQLDSDASRWMAGLDRSGSVRVAASERLAFFEHLHALPSPPPIELPPGFNVPEVAVTPSPRLFLHAPDPEAPPGTPIYGRLSFDYDRTDVAAEPPRRAIFDASRWRLLLRDRAAESSARERLAALSFGPAERGYLPPAVPEGAHLQIAPKHLPAAARALVEEGWRVEASGKLYRTPGTFHMGITSGIDWFELSAKVDFEGVSADLADVLSALRRGEHTIVLGDGSVGILPEDWLSRYGLLVDMGTPEGGKIRYRKAQIGLLDALLSSVPEIEVDAVFARARQDLARSASIEAARPPPSFQGELRPYQRDGLGWLLFLDRLGFGGCLADDMGLGKTVQVLAFLAARKHAGRSGTALVVAPRSIVFNWKAEAARFTPGLRVLDHTGANRLPPGPHFHDHDIVITTYGTLRRDAEALSRMEFDHAILDEAQAIKNERSDTAKASRLLRADHRLALSGTPIENHLGELWSLFEFLNPGILGRASVFKGASGRAEIPEATLSLLARALRPFILRRTKAAVAKDLPDKQEETLVCELEGRQRSLYDQMRNHYRASLKERVAKGGIARAKIHILEALLRLRQIACHPGLVDPRRERDPSAKLDALFAELPAIRENGHKTLVFSQFTSLLAIVRRRLDEEGVPYEYLDGRTRDRAARVERFQQDPGCPLFLVSLKAGGLGLNLTAAEYVFLLDPWWNPAVEAQAIDRAHRIGQEKPVFAYRMIAKDTIEERIVELQRTKRRLAESVIEADAGLLRQLTVEDLDLLLS